MLLKYIKIGTLVHHLAALRERWQPLLYTILAFCMGVGYPSGKKKKDYTEAEPVQKMSPAQLRGLLCTKHTLT